MPHAHRRNLADAVLIGPRMPAMPQYSSVSGDRTCPEVDVAARAARRNDDGLARADVDLLAAAVHDDHANHSPAVRRLPVETTILCWSNSWTPAFFAAASSGRIRPLPDEVSGAMAGSAGFPVAPSANS